MDWFPVQTYIDWDCISESENGLIVIGLMKHGRQNMETTFILY